MIQPKIQEVILPIKEVLDSNIINYIEKRFSRIAPKDYIVKELKKDFETTKLVTFTPQEFETFKREWALEVLNKAKDTDINTAWINIKRELQSKFKNKI